MKYLIILGCSVVLSSCANLPTTKEQMLTSKHETYSFCSSKDFTTIDQKTQKYLSKCYNAPKVIVNGANVSATYFIQKSIVGEVAEYSVTMQQLRKDPAYLLSITISPDIGDCKYKVVSNGFNSYWIKNSKKIEESINGESPSCPIF